MRFGQGMARRAHRRLLTGAGILVFAVAGCSSSDEGRDRRGAYGTSADEVPVEVFDAYEAIAGRPFPDDVDVLGWRYNFGWLDDGVFFVVETSADRAEELAALEQAGAPDSFGQTDLVDVRDDRIDAALERRPIRAYAHQGVSGVSQTIIMGDDDVVTVVLNAFEL